MSRVGVLAAGVLSVAAITIACTPAQGWKLAELLARKVECAIAHQELSDAEILAVCSVDPRDAKTVLDLVTESRKAGARAGCYGGIRLAPTCADGGSLACDGGTR